MGNSLVATSPPLIPHQAAAGVLTSAILTTAILTTATASENA